MNDILVVMSPTRKSNEALHWAMHTAKQTKRKIKLVFVVEDGTDGKRDLEGLERQCRTFQSEFESSCVVGEYFKVCVGEADKNKADILVFIEPRLNLWRRLFGKRESQNLKDHITCELKVYES